MKRGLRNRLNELLLEAFADSSARLSLQIMAILVHAAHKAEVEGLSAGIPVALLRTEIGCAPEEVCSSLARLAEPPGLIVMSESAQALGAIKLSEPARAARDELEKMIAAYLAAVDTLACFEVPRDRLDCAFLQARICFDLGLFFEAHEILEEQWRPLPRGSLRTLLQGLIQISVGFHHARHANRVGTVNQLGKGLEKLSRVLAKFPDPAAEAFRQAVSGLRERVLPSGPERMSPLPSTEVPPFPGELPFPFRAKSGGSQDPPEISGDPGRGTEGRISC